MVDVTVSRIKILGWFTYVGTIRWSNRIPQEPRMHLRRTEGWMKILWRHGERGLKSSGLLSYSRNRGRGFYRYDV